MYFMYVYNIYILDILYVIHNARLNDNVITLTGINEVLLFYCNILLDFSFIKTVCP